jgi:hypothetical protein
MAGGGSTSALHSRNAAGVGREADAIDQTVRRCLNPTIHLELIKLAVQDALEQHRLRW